MRRNANASASCFWLFAQAAPVAFSFAFDNAGNSLRLAGYGTVDLRVEYAINEAWSLQARAANVFDRAYETVAWYNQPGREYRLSVRYQPK